MGKCSVIIPYCDAAGTLPDAAESVLRQTDPDWELLLVDNGSQDEGPALASKLAAQDGRIRLLTSERGVSRARNRGLDAAYGEYVTFLDADDALHPEFLAVLRKELEETGADFAGSGFAIVRDRSAFPNGEMLAGRNDSRSERPGPSMENNKGEGSAADHDAVGQDGAVPAVSFREQTAETFLREGILGNDTRVWSKLFRRETVAGTRFREDLTIGEDTLFVLELLPRVKKAAVTREKLYWYYDNPGGAMNRPFAESYFDQVRCWQEAEQFTEEQFRAPADEPELRARFAARQAVGICLTASKLALADAETRRRMADRTEQMRGLLRSCARTPGMEQYLPAGYRQKVRLFAGSPALYFAAYGLWKKRTRQSREPADRQG